MAMLVEVELETKALMRRAEVVDAANQVHALLKKIRSASQGSAAPRQTGQALAKGGIEPFDVGSVETTITLAALEHPPNHGFTALDNAALDLQDTPDAPLDDLSDGDFRPSHQLRSPYLAGIERRTKSPSKGFEVAGKAINRQKQLLPTNKR
jgi:hypothetical protein